ncbi:MAG: L-glutamate gamma-semialdehyde dehydrogenase [Bacteroidota bacterium]
MNNSIFNFSLPVNEPIKTYAKNTPEREALNKELDIISQEILDIPLIIGGKEVRTGIIEKIVMPHNHKHVIAHCHQATEKEVNMAIEASLKAHKVWEQFSWVERLSVTVKIAELVSTKFRYRLNAATMLGQSKNAHQAEIDSACEIIDFLRFNAYYVSEIYNQQPVSENGIINRIEYRPLEGFILSITPFNFTAIASNLNLAPVLMGNVTIWKPAQASVYSNYILMQIFKEAGLPDGVVNFIPGSGPVVGNAAIAHPMLAGIHFTGSTNTFNHLWKSVGNNLGNYKSYPKMVGETGGKDFVFVHPSANADEVATALIRGSFEFQGQKCSAASRAYIPESLWGEIHQNLSIMMAEITVGDVRKYSNFMNAVIDEKSFSNCMKYINAAKIATDAEIIFGGNGDKSVGYFIEPTMILTTNPHFLSMEEEIFGPILTLYIYEDDKLEEALNICECTSPYALTGAIFSKDRVALLKASEILKYAAGNLYYNDKPTGAVVGQQPFGGARSSGTNDKAGSHLNLLRWTSPRTIKETLVAPTYFKYPFMED